VRFIESDNLMRVEKMKGVENAEDEGCTGVERMRARKSVRQPSVFLSELNVSFARRN
jgi:hypothetical protein